MMSCYLYKALLHAGGVALKLKDASRRHMRWCIARSRSADGSVWKASTAAAAAAAAAMTTRRSARFKGNYAFADIKQRVQQRSLRIRRRRRNKRDKK